MYRIIFLFIILNINSSALANLDDMMLDDIDSETMDILLGIEKPLNISPGSLTVFTEKDFIATGARNLMEILDTVPSFQTYYSAGPTVGLVSRGIASPQGVIVKINNVPIRQHGQIILGTSFSDWYGHLPLTNVERIEIIRGPAGLVHGWW